MKGDNEEYISRVYLERFHQIIQKLDNSIQSIKEQN